MTELLKQHISVLQYHLSGFTTIFLGNSIRRSIAEAHGCEEIKVELPDLDQGGAKAPLQLQNKTFEERLKTHYQVAHRLYTCKNGYEADKIIEWLRESAKKILAEYYTKERLDAKFADLDDWSVLQAQNAQGQYTRQSRINSSGFRIRHRPPVEEYEIMKILSKTETRTQEEYLWMMYKYLEMAQYWFTKPKYSLEMAISQVTWRAIEILEYGFPQLEKIESVIFCTGSAKALKENIDLNLWHCVIVLTEYTNKDVFSITPMQATSNIISSVVGKFKALIKSKAAGLVDLDERVQLLDLTDTSPSKAFIFLILVMKPEWRSYGQIGEPQIQSPKITTMNPFDVLADED
jgi:hypothetical protein